MATSGSLDMDIDFSPEPELPKLIDIELERSILGQILLSPSSIFMLAGSTVCAEWFHFASHARLFKSMMAIHARNEEVNITSVSIEVAKGLTSEQQMEYKRIISELIDECISNVNLDAYLKLLGRKWKARRTVAIAQEIIQKASKGTQPEEIASDAIRDLESLLGDGQSMSRMTDVMAGVVDNISEAQTQREAGKTPKRNTVPTGFYDQDKMLVGDGLLNGELHFVAARPGMGKTTYLGQVAIQVALQKLKVAFFSLEMAKRQIAENILANLTETDRDLLVKAQVDSGWWDQAAKFTVDDTKFPFWICDDRSNTIDSIRAKCFQLKQQEGLDFVVIDYLDLIEDDAWMYKMPRHERLAYKSRQLVILAGKLDVPILCAGQLSRSLESRASKVPMLSDLGGSDGPARDAHTALLLYRDEKYNDESSEKGIVRGILDKNRSGSTGVFHMLAKLEYSKLLNAKM